MTFTLLRQTDTETWQRRRLTYPEVGATAGDLPPGYHRFSRTRRLPATRDLQSLDHGS